MKAILLILFTTCLLSGCKTLDLNQINYQSASIATGIKSAELKSLCRDIKCKLDKYGGFRAEADDRNALVSFIGDKKHRNISLVWLGGSRAINIYAHAIVNTSRQGDEYAEIYIRDQFITKVGKNVYQRGNLRRIEDFISFEMAGRIANANSEDITIKFYDSSGSSDRTVSSGLNKLANVVRIGRQGMLKLNGEMIATIKGKVELIKEISMKNIDGEFLVSKSNSIAGGFHILDGHIYAYKLKDNKRVGKILDHSNWMYVIDWITR